MVQQTTNGLRYPESTDDARLFEHIQDLAEDVDPHIKPTTQQTFESSGTWNKPAGLKFVHVVCIGGGAAGGGSPSTTSSQCSAGAGGTGGGTAISLIATEDLGSSETVTVGSGGSAVSGANGNDGGDTSFGSHCAAPGGLGGDAEIAHTNDFMFDGRLAPNSGLVGNVITFRGGAGGGAIRIPTNNTCLGGFGGDSSRGTGGRPSGNGNNGLSGQSYGGGGSGASSRQSEGNRPGGDGGDGVVIVTEYY